MHSGAFFGVAKRQRHEESSINQVLASSHDNVVPEPLGVTGDDPSVRGYYGFSHSLFPDESRLKVYHALGLSIATDDVLNTFLEPGEFLVFVLSETECAPNESGQEATGRPRSCGADVIDRRCAEGHHGSLQPHQEHIHDQAPAFTMAFLIVLSSP
jgi:hypothetical protein